MKIVVLIIKLILLFSLTTSAIYFLLIVSENADYKYPLFMLLGLIGISFAICAGLCLIFFGDKKK